MANKIVEFARQYIGKAHYVFGANDSSSLNWDCSSFTQFVYKNFGVNIGRTTFEQVNAGREIPISEAQPGDIVLFQNTYTPGVSHVGIYSGNGKFIHNSSSKKTVVESDLNSDYYKNHFHSVRRVSDTGSGDEAQTAKTEDKINDEGISLSFVGSAIVAILAMLCIVVGAVFFVQAFDINIF